VVAVSRNRGGVDFSVKIIEEVREGKRTQRSAA
jgi:hypothetical protein